MSRTKHQSPHYPDLIGQLGKSYHLELITDRARTEAIFAALRRVLRDDMVFCELGCGTGIFSVYAATRVKKCYAVEIDPEMWKDAKRNIEDSHYSTKITLLNEDAMEVSLPEQADVIFCEMMSIWCVEEPQIKVINRARQDLLKPGGIVVPMRIVNLADLGHYDFRRSFSDGEITMKAVCPLFTGIHRPAIMTERLKCLELDFVDQIDTDLSVDVKFTAMASGTINCARLTSIVQFDSGIVFSGSDSLMPPTVVPLQEDLVDVKVGDTIRFRAALRARGNLGESPFVAEVVR